MLEAGVEEGIYCHQGWYRRDIVNVLEPLVVGAPGIEVAKKESRGCGVTVEEADAGSNRVRELLGPR